MIDAIMLLFVGLLLIIQALVFVQLRLVGSYLRTFLRLFDKYAIRKDYEENARYFDEDD